MDLQVSGKLAELKTTIDAGLSHRVNLLENIGTQFEQWNLLVCQKNKLTIFCVMRLMNMV